MVIPVMLGVTIFSFLMLHLAPGDPAVLMADGLAASVADAEAVALMTAWPEFGGLATLLADRADPPLVVDGRRMLPPTAFARYRGIGLGTGG